MKNTFFPVTLTDMSHTIMGRSWMWRDAPDVASAFKPREISETRVWEAWLTVREALELIDELLSYSKLYTSGGLHPTLWPFGHACAKDAHQIANDLRYRVGIKRRHVLNAEWREAFTECLQRPW